MGVGTGFYVAPGQITSDGTNQSAVVVLSHLGYCHGRRAYDAVEWYFPEHGKRYNPGTYINACTGTYYQNGKPLA